MKPTVTRRGGASAPTGPRRPGSGPAATAGGARPDARAFVQGVIAEMRRVTWPSREEWIAATILTVALVVGVGLFTWLVDLLLGQLFSLLTGGTR